MEFQRAYGHELSIVEPLKNLVGLEDQLVTDLCLLDDASLVNIKVKIHLTRGIILVYGLPGLPQWNIHPGRTNTYPFVIEQATYGGCQKLYRPFETNHS